MIFGTIYSLQIRSKNFLIFHIIKENKNQETLFYWYYFGNIQKTRVFVIDFYLLITYIQKLQLLIFLDYLY